MKIRLGFVSNSSSEAFICDTKMSLVEVKQKLEEIVKAYNLIYGHNFTFFEFFKEPSLITEKTSELEEWQKYYERQLRNSIGKIVIFSAGDNTIPYSLFEIINDIFVATNIHLG